MVILYIMLESSIGAGLATIGVLGAGGRYRSSIWLLDSRCSQKSFNKKSIILS